MVVAPSDARVQAILSAVARAPRVRSFILGGREPGVTSAEPAMSREIAGRGLAI